MACTHKTAQIKVQMAEEVRREEEARAQEATRVASVAEARTRSERVAALENARRLRHKEDGDAEEEKKDAEGGIKEEAVGTEAEGPAAAAVQDSEGAEEKKAAEVRPGAAAKQRKGKKRSAEHVKEDELVSVPPFLRDHKSWPEYNCGVFVCLHFWKCVSSEAPSDVSDAGITKMRWSMLHAILAKRR